MFGISLGMIVESSVSILLAVTIGYCVILNSRLKRLHPLIKPFLFWK